MYQGSDDSTPAATPSSAPDTRGDLQATNRAASAFKALPVLSMKLWAIFL